MAEETRIEAVGCALHPFERNRYFYGKLLTVRDFETDQGYMIGKDHLINSHVHGSGIVCGLELTDPKVENNILSVNLTAGVALDCCGNEIVVSKSTNRLEVRGTPKEGLNYVYLSYAECVKEPVPALANASTSEEVCRYNRIQETYTVSLSTEPPVRTDAAFEGKVEQRQGPGAPAPLAGARIEALQNGMVRTATRTNANGMYTLDVVAGTYDVRASATGYRAFTEIDRSVPAGGKLSIDFVLEPAADTDKPDAAKLCQDMTQRYYEEHLRICPQCADPKVLLAVVNRPPGGGQPNVDPETTRRYRSIVYSNPMLHDLLCDHVADFHNPHGHVETTDGRALQSINHVGNVEGGSHVSNVDLISSNSTIQIGPHPDTQQIDIMTTPATTVTSVGPTPAVGSSLNFAREDHVHTLADNAVTSAKIADNTIQLGDLQPDLQCMVVNVRTFGATGDGQTDDREAIQRAIDATRAARGGVVFFPAGDYVVGRMPTPETSETSFASFYIHGVTTATPLVFEGEGAASIIRMQEGSLGPDEIWAIFYVVASENVSFRHLRLHGNRSKITSPPENKQSHCILLKQAVDVTVQDVEFRETVGDGIFLRTIGEEPEAASRDLRIVENLFVDSGRHGISLGEIEDVVIQGNIFRNKESFAESVMLDGTRRVQFVSNTIRGGTISDGAVSCQSMHDFVISNNSIVGVSEQEGYVLRLNGSFGAVTGNNIHGAVSCESMHDFVISNNSIIGVSGKKEGQALFLHQGGFGAVTGNDIQTGNNIPGGQTTYKGISLKNSSRTRLSQNTIRARDTGLHIIDCTDISASDNVIESYETGVAGIDTSGVGIDVEAIDVEAIAASLVDAIQVRNNHIRNFKFGIHAAGKNEAPLTHLVVVGNQIRGSTPQTGAAIHIQSGVPAATVHGNQATSGETLLFLQTSAYIITATGFAGKGRPKEDAHVAAAVGSFYTSLDSETGSALSLWIKDTGETEDGWVQLAPRVP